MNQILVIEDEEPVREAIVELLNLENLQTIDTDNGRDGIRLAKELLPALIICNILMPDMDGYSVLIELRKEKATAKIPIIFLSAKAGEEARQQGLELGANVYLEKPVKIADLLEAIAAQLNLSQQDSQSD